MIEVEAVVGRRKTVTNPGLRKVTKEGKTGRVVEAAAAEGVVAVAVAEVVEEMVMGSPATQKGAESSTFRDLVQP